MNAIIRSDSVIQFIRALWPQTAALELQEVQPVERNIMGGKLFASAPRFVTLVGRALLRHPALCAGRPFDGPSLLRRQWRASALLCLRDNLLLLTQLVSDTYLAEQSGAVDDARSVLDEFNRRMPDLGEDDRREQRNALYPAALVLATSKEKKQKAADRRKQLLGKETRDGRLRSKAESKRAQLEGQRVLQVIRDAVLRGLLG